jgi:hypothetical protein
MKLTSMIVFTMAIAALLNLQFGEAGDSEVSILGGEGHVDHFTQYESPRQAFRLRRRRSYDDSFDDLASRDRTLLKVPSPVPAPAVVNGVAAVRPVAAPRPVAAAAAAAAAAE